MPNNDLGTAHGRIRIDFDDRGSATATQALVKIQKEFEALNKRVAVVEKAFNKNTRAIESNAKSYKKAESSTRSYISTLFGADRITKMFDKDIIDLTEDFIKLNRTVKETRERFKFFENAYRVLDNFKKIQLATPVVGLAKALNTLKLGKLSEGTHRAKAFSKALDSIGYGFQSLKRMGWEKIWGKSAAIGAMPNWTRNVYKFAASLGGLAAAGIAVSKSLDAGFITKFLDTGLFQRIVEDSNKAGAELEKFGGITKKLFGRNLFGGMSANLKNSEQGLTRFIKNLSHSLSGGSRAFNSWFKPFAGAAKNIELFTLGFGAMSAGIIGVISKFKWLGKIPKPILTALGVIISTIVPAAFQVLAKSLVFTSNALVGLWSGIKQLSGGLLALPGLIASIGVVAATVATIFGDLKDKFKDVFSEDPAKSWEAFNKLPEHLKPMATALKEVVKNFKEMRTELQKTAFKGIEDQIKSLSEKYMPILTNGMTTLTLTLRGAKDEFVKFLEQGQTQKDINGLFNNTNEILQNIKISLRPLLDGLRDIGSVGSRFIADLSYGLGNLSTKFATWARVNRENGQMLQWMQKSKEALKDLVVGTTDLTKGLWTVLTMFRTHNGSTWLDTYAAKMKRFKESMKMSSESGIIFDFANAVKGFAQGKEKIETFKSVFKSFLEMMNGVAPAIQNLSNAFSTIFIPQIKGAMEWLGNLSQIGSTLHLDSIIGAVLGLVAVIKLIPTFLGPILNTAKVVGGFFVTLSNAKKVVSAVENGVLKFATILEKIPFVGGKAAASVTRVAIVMRGLITTLATVALPITLIIAALTLMGLTIKGSNDDLKAFNEQLDANAAHATEAGKALNKAFLADNGKIGRTVMDQLSENMTQTMLDLEDTASKGPGLLDHIGKWFSTDANHSRWYTMEGADTNKWQKEAADAGRAAKKLRELRESNIDLEAVVTSSSDAYKTWITQLRNSGDNGNEAADVIDKQRKQFELFYESMQRMGPAGIQLAEGLQKIADAGGNAASKLDGLKLALQGLGFLKVDALQAAAEYTTTLGSLADDVKQAISESGEDVSKAFNGIDGSINTSSKLGAALVGVFERVSNSFLSTATTGADINDLMTRLRGQIDLIAPSLNKTGDELQAMLANSFGIVPEPIKLLLQLEGKEPVIRELGHFLMLLDANAKNHTIPVVLHFDNETAAKNIDQEIEKALGRDVTDVNGTDVVLKIGIAPISPEELGKLQAKLAEYGINTGPGAFAVPATMPVAPIPAAKAPTNTPPLPAPPVQQPLPAIAPPKPFMPAPTDISSGNSAYPKVTVPAAPAPQPQPQAMPDLTPKLDEASAKADEVDHKLRKFASNPAIIEVNSDKLKDAKTIVDDIDKKFAEKKLTANVEVSGMDKLQAASTSAQTFATGLTTVFDTLKSKINEAVETVKTKINELSAGIAAALDKAASSAADSGSKFVQALADGIATNPAAIQAAETLAAEIKKRFHQSPPKKGPLAAHGDAARYGGEMFVESYATGLRSNASRVAGAADEVAGQAAGVAMGQAGGKSGQFLGQLLEMTGFASQLVGVFQKVSDTMFRAMKFISDPLSKGTFFGQSLGFKRLSADELRKKQDREDQQSLRSMMDSSQRDDTVFKNKLKMITDAENAVVDQNGYKSGEAAKTVGALIKEAFPEIVSIGGARADSKPFHPSGNAIDIMIPNFDTKEGKALGDRINTWALSNASKLGIDYTIWQDFYQPTDGSKGNFMGNKDPNAGHYNHIHLNFAPGASVDLSGIEMSPQERADYQKKSAQDAAKTALEALQEQYGPPTLSQSDAIKTPQQLRLNPQTGQFEFYTPEGQKNLPDGYLNPETKKPWTKAEAEQYVRENPKVITLPDNMTMERFNQIMSDSNFVNTSQEETLARIGDGNAQIAKALEIARDPRAFDNQPNEVISALTAVDNEIIRLNETGTVGNQLIAQDLESVKSTIMEAGGYAQQANPIDTISSIIGQAAGVASDIIGTITTSIEAVGAAKDTADVLVRGMSGTQDVSRVVDNVQKFIELGASISGSVASVSGLIGSVVGAAGSGDPSGGASGAAAALGAVSTIASLIQAGYETANAVIDITQEATRIIGAYVGDFLGYLVGGPNGGPLGGNVRFLLDQQTNQLLAYSAENPMDKRVHNLIGGAKNPSSREQQSIGTINVYGGPGSDPRDLTRQMMFQVNAARYAGALAQ